MTREIDYATNTDLAAKSEAARDDLFAWLGEERFGLVSELFAHPETTTEQAQSVIMQLALFAGASGYPVYALLEYCRADLYAAVIAAQEGGDT